MNSAKGQTIGIDLGDRRHHVCVLNASGEILAEEVLPNSKRPAGDLMGTHRRGW